jgi:hypothetical protein
MKAALIFAAFVLVTAPAFAGDRGNKNGHDKQDSDISSDDGNNRNDSPGFGVQWTGSGQGSPPPNSSPDNTLEIGGAGRFSAPGQDN